MGRREIEGDCTVLFSCLFKKIASCGLTKQEFAGLKQFPLGHGSVAGFVDANVKVGNFQWLGNRLVNTDRRFLLDLNPEEIGRLRYRALKQGLSEQEYISQVLSDFLKIQ